MAGTKKRRKISLFKGEPKPWGDLHISLLFKIFSHLSPKHLFLKVSLVCNSWRPICWDILFRQDLNTLDLTPIESIVGALCPSSWVRDRKYPENFLKALLESMLASHLEVQGGDRELITTVLFPRNLHISGLQELTFVAERTPNIKKLVLPDGYELKEECFSEAFKHWKLMEEIFIGTVYNNHMIHIIQELGTNCKNLSKLVICKSQSMSGINELARIWGPKPGEKYFKLDINNAKLIAKNLKNLKQFSVMSDQVHKEGVRVMLEECKQVAKLCFERTFLRHGAMRTISLDLTKKIALRSEAGAKWSIGSGKRLLTSRQLLERYIKWHKPDGQRTKLFHDFIFLS